MTDGVQNIDKERHLRSTAPRIFGRRLIGWSDWAEPAIRRGNAEGLILRWPREPTKWVCSLP